MSTKEKILQAARQYLIDHGQASFTVRAIAGEADVNPGLVHHYFGSKDNLILEILEVESAILYENAVKMKAEMGLEAIKTAIMSGFFGNLAIGQLFVEAIILSEKSETVKKKLGEIIQDRREYFTKLFGVTDPLDQVLVQSMIFGLQLIRKINPEIDIEKSIHRFYNRFMVEGFLEPSKVVEQHNSSDEPDNLYDS